MAQVLKVLRAKHQHISVLQRSEALDQDHIDFDFSIAGFADRFAVLLSMLAAARTFAEGPGDSENAKKKAGTNTLLPEGKAMEKFILAKAELQELNEGVEPVLPPLLCSVNADLELIRARADTQVGTFVSLIGNKSPKQQMDNSIKFLMELLTARLRVVSQNKTGRTEGFGPAVSEATAPVRFFLEALKDNKSLNAALIKEASDLHSLYDFENASVEVLRDVMK